MRLATRAASMAVLPAPTTTMLPERLGLTCFFSFFIHSMTPCTLPSMSSLPAFHAPVARRIWV